MKLSFLWISLLCLCSSLLAQVPQGINFQAVARDGSGVPMSNVTVTVAFRVMDAGNILAYHESHTVTTDNYGLFTAVLGDGTPIFSTFSAVNWGTSQHKVEVILNGAPMLTCDFESVPYALYAEKANMEVGDLTNVDLTGLAPGETLIWNGTNWVPGTGGSTIWSQNGTTAHYDLGRVGIGIDTAKTTLHLRDTANFLIGDDLTGSGYKLIYYGAKGAMRVGYLNNPFGGYNYNKFWDYDSVGYYSFAAGQNSRAKGFGSFAFGSFGWADGSGSVAFFGNAKGNGSVSFSGSSKGLRSFTFRGTADDEGGIAMYGYTGGRYGVSIGGGSTGLGASSSREDYAIAIGWNSDARGQASIALGPADAYGYNSFATGWVTEARGNYSSTFGYQTNSYPYASMALGRYNLVTGDSANWVTSDPVFIIGDGTSNNNRSNSFLIQKNGQTAIGYNAPAGMLQVSSALGSLNNGGTLDPTNATLLLGSTTSGLAFDPNQIESIGTGLHLNFNSNRDIYLVNGGGDVAIGHQAPLAKLDVESAGWQMRMDNDNAGGDDWYIGSSATSWAAGAGKLLFSPTSASGNSALTITGTRQVGIGINAPSDRLHVYADAGEDALRVQIAGTTRFRVHDNGGVSIGGNVGPPAGGLYVFGVSEFDGDVLPDNDNQYDLGGPLNRWDNVWATNGIIQTSDLRDKTDIAPLKYGLNTVMRMRPVSYKWRDKPEEGKKVGVIAQELKQVAPELVHQNPDDPAGRMGVNYAEAVPILIKAIQEQQTQIKQQQILIEKLQADVEALKANQDE